MRSRFDELPFKTAADWHSVLVVADLFNFTECGIRKLAITQLETAASGVEKIMWGAKFGIKSFLLQGYGEVCNRNSSLTAQELLQLRDQPQVIELIMKKREALLYDSGRCARCPRSRAQVSEAELAAYFKEQLKVAY